MINSKRSTNAYVVSCFLFRPFSGGDWAECYELVMKEAREKLSWTPGTNRVLVMIGDATPHSPDDYGREFKGEKIDWKEETEKLLNTVRMFLPKSVSCMESRL